ncbi:MAG: Smr/MutS family protein [Bacteroidales bacterium]|nr:Smr/MutS family protein [Bacteroidales bacterium]
MSSLSPLFVLKTGIQGSSFTFEIAQRIGFPEEIINSAKSLINSPQYEYETMAQQLETEFIKIDEEKKALKLADNFLAELIEKHQTLLHELESQKKIIIKEAKLKALNIIKDSNSLVEKTIREIKETNAEKESVSKLRKEIETEKQKLTDNHSKTTPKNREKKLPPKTVNISKSELKEGSVVFLPEIDTQAVIIEIVKDKKVTLDINGVIFRTDLDKIEPISLSESKSLKKNPTKSSSIYQRINEKAGTFKPHIDIRGKRAEESIQEVEKLIDDALQLGVKELKILHGKGSGVLRKVIREVLAKSPYVESFEDEKLEMGGHGITNVKIK